MGKVRAVVVNGVISAGYFPHPFIPSREGRGNF